MWVEGELEIRSPIRWFGGKGNMVTKLLPLLPPHKIYVEPFGGGASLLFAKAPSPVEIYNDIDSGLVNFFRVIRDPEKFDKFYRLVCLTPYSREEYDYCRSTWEECDDEIERAYRWFVVARMSFSGGFSNSWSFAVTNSCRNMAATCSKWLSTIEMLPQIHQRLMRVQIEHSDFRNIFNIYDTPDTLFYCDPPYVHDTRTGTRYKHEMTDKDHEELVRILLNIKGMSLLSGYKHSIYEPLEKVGWQRHDFQTACYAVGKTRRTKILGKGSIKKALLRTESVWVSPSCNKNTLLPFMEELPCQE